MSYIELRKEQRINQENLGFSLKTAALKSPEECSQKTKTCQKKVQEKGSGKSSSATLPFLVYFESRRKSIKKV